MKLLDKFNERFPSGFVGGHAIGIVGDFGLKIYVANYDTTISATYYKKGDRVPITFCDKNGIYLSGMPNGRIKVPISSFEKFEVKNIEEVKTVNN